MKCVLRARALGNLGCLLAMLLGFECPSFAQKNNRNVFPTRLEGGGARANTPKPDDNEGRHPLDKLINPADPTMLMGAPMPTTVNPQSSPKESEVDQLPSQDKIKTSPSESQSHSEVPGNTQTFDSMMKETGLTKDYPPNDQQQKQQP